MDQTTIVVTGAAKSGLGEAITRRLLTNGSRVIGTFEIEDTARAEALLRDFEAHQNLVLSQVDHASISELNRFATSVSGPVNGIVHSQFFFAMENPNNFDHELWNKSLSINLTAPNYLTHELKDRLAPASSVIVITSTEGFIGSFGASAYAASKAAIHNLVKTLANNLGARGIRVNAVAAGWIGGVMDTDEVFNMSRRITPLGRLGLPEEVAAVVSFLLSDEASFVNGTTVTADGGYTGVDTIAKYEYEHTSF